MRIKILQNLKIFKNIIEINNINLLFHSNLLTISYTFFIKIYYLKNKFFDNF
jgi:hypothetical protein